MDFRKLRIVYMGTPGFAVAPLEKLLETGCNVAAVVTAPDRPAGRGNKIRYSAVKEFATLREVKILQPENLKAPEFLSEIHGINPDLQVVVAFRMLPREVWSLPPLGTFNLHASLLPDYRGAAPINRVIMDGETRTGVTTFLIDEQIDTGRILLRKETSIGHGETAGELHDRLMGMGAEMVLETVQQLADGSLEATSQKKWISQGSLLRSAPKIRKEDCLIDWTRPGQKICNQIRGLSPTPGAFSYLERSEGERILCKVLEATFEPSTGNPHPGSVVTDGKTYLKVSAADGLVGIRSLQLEGRRRMNTGEFLHGINLFSSPNRFSSAASG